MVWTPTDLECYECETSIGNREGATVADEILPSGRVWPSARVYCANCWPCDDSDGLPPSLPPESEWNYVLSLGGEESDESEFDLTA